MNNAGSLANNTHLISPPPIAASSARSGRTAAAPTYSPSTMRMPQIGLSPSTHNSHSNLHQNFFRTPNQNMSDEHLNQMEMGYLTNGTNENLTSESRENLNQIETGNSAPNEMTGSSPTSKLKKIAKYALAGGIVSVVGGAVAIGGHALGVKSENYDHGDNFLEKTAAFKAGEGPAKMMLAGMGVVGLGVVIALWPCLPKPVRNCLENCGSGC